MKAQRIKSILARKFHHCTSEGTILRFRYISVISLLLVSVLLHPIQASPLTEVKAPSTGTERLQRGTILCQKYRYLIKSNLKYQRHRQEQGTYIDHLIRFRYDSFPAERNIVHYRNGRRRYDRCARLGACRKEEERCRGRGR